MRERNPLNFNTVNWDLFTDYEHQLTDHESSDVDLESTLEDISRTNDLTNETKYY